MKNPFVSFIVLCSLMFAFMACSENVEPDFSFTPEMPRRGERVTFTNLTTADEEWEAESWTWTFGDGGSSLSKNPVYTYKEAGKYKVTLMVDSLKRKMKTMDIIVYDSIPTIYTAADSVKYYQPVTFSVLAYNPYYADVTYKWTFSDNAVIVEGDSVSAEVKLYFTQKKVSEIVKLHINIKDETDTTIVDTFYVHDVKAKSLLMAQKGGDILRQRIFNQETEPSESMNLNSGQHPFKMHVQHDMLYVFDAGSDISEKADWLTDTSGDGNIRVVRMSDTTVTEIVHNRNLSAVHGFYHGFVDKDFVYWTDRYNFIYRLSLGQTIGALGWDGSEEAQAELPYYLVKADRLGYFGKGLANGQLSAGMYYYDQMYFWAKGGNGRGIYRFLSGDILKQAAISTTLPPTAGAILTDFAIRAFEIDELNRKIYFSATAPAGKEGLWVSDINGYNAKRIDDAPVDSPELYISGIVVDNTSNRVYWAYRSPETLGKPAPSGTWASWYETHPTHRTGVKMATLANEFKSPGPIAYFAPGVSAFGIALDNTRKF